MNGNEHLDPHQFDRILRKALPPPAFEAAHLHLYQCVTCRSVFLEAEDGAARHLAEVFGPHQTAEWRQDLEEGAAWEVEPRDLAAYDLYKKLEQRPPEQWPLAFANAEELQHEVGVAAMLERAKELWGDRPEHAEQLIVTARVALDVMRARSDAAGWAAWRGRVEAYAGNIHRIFGRFPEARSRLETAQAWLAAAECGPGQMAELHWLQGVLARAERRFDDSAELLKTAMEEPNLTGGYTLAQEIGMVLGNVYGEAGEPEKAIEEKERLFYTYSRSELGPRNYLVLTQSLATEYAQTGRVDEARKLLRVVKELAADLDLGTDRHRVTWLEALIRRAEGLRPVAASLYREVYQGFLAEEMPYDAALALLDLAEMHLAEGDTRSAAELAEDLVPVFKSRGIHREATMAGLILVRSLRHQAATAAQVQEVIGRLRGGGKGVGRG